MVSAAKPALHIERALRGSREQHARGKRIAGIEHRVDGRLSRMRGYARGNRPAKPRGIGVREGG
jgi:hypothetical protein